MGRNNKPSIKDLHVLRFFSSFVKVSDGCVVEVGNPPFLRHCPLASLLYPRLRRAPWMDKAKIKEEIKRAVEKKIEEFGFFTEKRKLSDEIFAVPFGASEMLMSAIKRRVIDAAVLVCDGAGTVIADRPEVVQGIGARMNGLFRTSPIPKVMERLKELGCRVVFPNAAIDQIEGVRKAAELGYRKIAVTINGYAVEKRSFSVTWLGNPSFVHPRQICGEPLGELGRIEKQKNISVTSLVVCTTGVDEKRAEEVFRNADLVWSCSSKKIRAICDQKAIVQVSKTAPVLS